MTISAHIFKAIKAFEKCPISTGVISYIIFTALFFLSFNHVFPLAMRWIVLILFLCIGTIFSQRSLVHFMRMPKWHLYAMSCIFFILVVSVFAGIPLVFYRYNPLIFSLFTPLPLLLGLIRTYQKSENREAGIENADIVVCHSMHEESFIFHLPIKKMVVTALITGIIAILFFIFARTGDHILHPWQVIHPLALWAVALLTGIVVTLIFSQASWKIVLWLIIFHSLVLHAYLPIVYDGGFGGDRWRHIASERYLLTGNIYEPGLIADKTISIKKIAGIAVPEVFIAGNKTSYAPQWALTILFHQMTGFSLEDVDQWLVPLLWFWFVPIMMYAIGKVLFSEQRWHLLTAFIPSMFFPYQVYGSITIAVGIGQMIFLFVFYALLLFIRTKQSSYIKFGAIATGAQYMSYILHLFLGVIGVLLAVCLNWFYAKKQKAWLYVFSVLCFIVLVALIPLSEHIFGFSTFQFEKLYPQTLVSSVADAFGRLTNIVGYNHYGSYIGEGNFLYEANRLPKSAVSFLRWPYWPMILYLIVYGIAGIGWVLALKKTSPPHLSLPLESKERSQHLHSFTKEGVTGSYDLQWKFIALFCGVLGISYFISWFLMDGYHTLARRLDLTIALFIGLLFLYGARWIIHRFSLPLLYKEGVGGGILTAHNILIVFIVGVSFVTLSTYASGPILDRVTRDELSAAQYLWEQTHISTPPSLPGRGLGSPYCVLANTWPLLALESMSARDIIGGGFPLYNEYAQPERVKLFEKMSQHPNQELLDKALAVTEASTCFYMTEYRFINRRVYTETVNLLGEPEKIFGDVLIWRYVSRL